MQVGEDGYSSRTFESAAACEENSRKHESAHVASHGAPQPPDRVQIDAKLTEASFAAILDVSAATDLHRRLLRRLLRDVANFCVGPERPCFASAMAPPRLEATGRAIGARAAPRPGGRCWSGREQARLDSPAIPCCEVGASLIGTAVDPVEDSILSAFCIATKVLQGACVKGWRIREGWKGRRAQKKNDRFMRTQPRREAVLRPIFDVSAQS